MKLFKQNQPFYIDNNRDLMKCARYLLGNRCLETDNTDIHENFSLGMLLLADFLTHSHEIRYKAIIKNSNDPPDFFLIKKETGQVVGLEHVRATLESFQIAKKELLKNPEIKFLDSSYYQSNNELSPKNAFIGLKKDVDELDGPPMYGDSPLKNWVELIINAIHEKEKPILRWNSPNLASRELLIEVDSTPLIGRNYPDAAQFLKKEYLRRVTDAKFDKVHIFYENHVIIDIMKAKNPVVLGIMEIKKLYDGWVTHYAI